MTTLLINRRKSKIAPTRITRSATPSTVNTSFLLLLYLYFRKKSIEKLAGILFFAKKIYLVIKKTISCYSAD